MSTESTVNHDDPKEMLELLAMLGSATFLEQLIPPTDVATLYSRFNSTNSRNFLLLQILVEVQKAGLAMRTWRLSSIMALREKPLTEVSNPDQLVMAGMIDAQSMFQRKLTESLVLLINFSSTNRPDYYYHFLLINELRRCDSDLKEQKSFFISESQATRKRRDRILDKIVDVERGFPPSACPWYIKSTSGQKREAVSFSKQLDLALPISSDRERQALCYTYGKGFGENSGNIHLNPLNPDPTNPFLRFSFGFAVCGTLALLVLKRAHDLSGVQPKGINLGLSKAITQPTKPQSRMILGDFVLAYGPCLGVIEEIRSSPHGYVSYRVKYLGDLPEPTVTEDWIPEFDLQLFQSRTDLRAALEERVTAMMNEGLPRPDPPFTEAEKEEAIRHSMEEIWKLGLGVYMRREAVPKVQPRSDPSLDP